jgi:triacylglycerol lipase
MSRPHVYLVPGFLGFTQLGTFNYFYGVSRVLRDELAARGMQADVIETSTPPSGSIRRRALRLLDIVRETGGAGRAPVHFVGHSTGGLDVRLLLTPDVRLVADSTDERIGDNARSAITISTPHFGTPLANFFTSLNGRNILFLLTTLVTSSPGRMTAYLAARALVILAHLDDYVGQRGTLLDSWAENVFRHVTPDRGSELFSYLRNVSADQGAMAQLMPTVADLFNAAVTDRADVTYSSFATAAPPPSLDWWTWRDIYTPLTYALYAITYTLAAREHRHYPYPWPSGQAAAAMRAPLPFPIDRSTNDGVVPTLSQIWGRLRGVVVADHLDVVGQFPQSIDDHEYAGWIHSGANFREPQFRALWSAVADAIVEAREGTERAVAPEGDGPATRA